MCLFSFQKPKRDEPVKLSKEMGCFKYRWHHDIVKLFYLFLWGGTLSYVGIGTVSL